MSSEKMNNKLRFPSIRNCLLEIKRLYQIIFEERPIDTIRNDFYEHKWISKSELSIIVESLEFEKLQLLNIVNKSQQEYKDLLGSFNLNAMEHYLFLQRQQGKY